MLFLTGPLKFLAVTVKIDLTCLESIVKKVNDL